MKMNPDINTKNEKQFVKLGFSQEETEDVISALNLLLANMNVYSQKLRNFHWNVTGDNFFDLHAKFEELYTISFENIDQVAERIRIFGHTPISNLKDYLETSQVEEAGTTLSSGEMVAEILLDMETVESFLVDVVDVAAEIGDVGTMDLINKMVRQIEKEHWMLSAFSAR